MVIIGDDISLPHSTARLGAMYPLSRIETLILHTRRHVEVVVYAAYNSPAVETVEGGRRFPTTPMHGIATAQLIGVANRCQQETSATSYVQYKMLSHNPPVKWKR